MRNVNTSLRQFVSFYNEGEGLRTGMKALADEGNSSVYFLRNDSVVCRLSVEREGEGYLARARNLFMAKAGIIHINLFGLAMNAAMYAGDFSVKTASVTDNSLYLEDELPLAEEWLAPETLAELLTGQMRRIEKTHHAIAEMMSRNLTYLSN